MDSSAPVALHDPLTFPAPATHEKDLLTLEVFPHDGIKDDLCALEANVRAIRLPGVTWAEGAFRREEVAFGINKLVVCAIIENGRTETARVQDAVSNLQWGNHAAVSSVEFASFVKA